MRTRKRLCKTLMALMIAPSAAFAGQPTIVGWLEPIQLGREAINLPAKLDTGADVSSLHVSRIERTQRQDGEWVAFDVVGADQRTVRMERKVERVARVRNAAGGVQERPTVRLGVCLGDTYRVAEVNLADRSALKVPFLVGRNFLAERFAVDSSRTNTLQPACTAQAIAETATEQRPL